MPLTFHPLTSNQIARGVKEVKWSEGGKTMCRPREDLQTTRIPQTSDHVKTLRPHEDRVQKGKTTGIVSKTMHVYIVGQATHNETFLNFMICSVRTGDISITT